MEYFEGAYFPKGISLNHKFVDQVLEIGFPRRKIHEILAVKADWPEDIVVVQRHGTASLAIRVPYIDMKIGVAAQLPAIEEALRAAYRLMPYASLLQGLSKEPADRSAEQ